jgi:hypothetical protein
MIISSFMISEFYALESSWKGGGSLEGYNGYHFVDYYGGGRKMRMKYKMRIKYRLNAFVWYCGEMFSSLSNGYVENGTCLDCCYALVSANLSHLPTLQVLKSGGYLELTFVKKIIPTKIGEDYGYSWLILGDNFWGHQLIKFFRLSRRGRKR